MEGNRGRPEGGVRGGLVDRGVGGGTVGRLKRAGGTGVVWLNNSNLIH